MAQLRVTLVHTRGHLLVNMARNVALSRVQRPCRSA